MDRKNDIETTLLGSRGTILGYIRKKVGGDPDLAEDILQDSLLKALRSAPDLRDDDKLIGWFYRIVDNAVIDLFRRRKIEAKYLAEAAEEEPGVVPPAEHRKICSCMNGIIPTLKPEYAMLVRELELEEGDPEEVADRLGITRNNLKVRRHRARTQLRERLEQICGACAKHGCLDCGCHRG